MDVASGTDRRLDIAYDFGFQVVSSSLVSVLKKRLAIPTSPFFI